VKRIPVFLPVILFVIFSLQKILAQTTVNPDISFIGDFRLIDYNKAPNDIGANKPQFDFRELEIAAGSYLNPYARADVTLGVSSEGIDIEEAYATLLRGLPWNLQVRAGQYLVDFGKLNTQHAHQWSWIERPLMFKRFFGEEGFKGVGLNLTTLVPIGTSALNFSASLIQGGFLLPSSQEDIAPALAGNGRISLFAPLAEHSEIEFGISGLYAQHDPVNKFWTKMGDFDFKYKWKPDIYRSLIVVAEALINSRKISLDSLNSTLTRDVASYGAFATFDYQFHRRYDAGAFVDYSQSPVDKNDHLTGYGVFCGFALAEETYRVGVLLRQDEGTGLNSDYQTVEIQLLWSLGPHKPHQF
jgi:hypothetical protein